MPEVPAPAIAPVHDLEIALRGDAPATSAGQAVRAAALAAGLPAERATRLQTVVEELIAESRAREAVDGAGDVVVRAHHDGGRFRVEVHDRRLPLAPGEARSVPSRRLAALGFIDRLHITSRGVEGNVAECRIDLDGGADPEVAGHEAVLPADVPRASDDEATALEIRPMTSEDAPGLARCVYRCYGYSYVDPLLYRPAHIRRAMGSGRLHSVVAVAPGGEVVGHCALTFDAVGDRVPEGGKLVVDPRYRGHHLAESLAARRLEVGRELGIPGIWFECVTNHPFSQKEVLGTGGSETGLLLGATPASVTMAGLDNHPEARHALLAMYVPLAGDRPAELHLQERHAAFLGLIARRLGLTRTADTTIVEPTGTTMMGSGFSPGTGVAQLRVHRVGGDLAARVGDELDALAAWAPAVTTLDLPLWDPAAAWAAQQLERPGFALAAWLPDLEAEGDVLRLQRVGDTPVDLDHIACARPEGEAVRDHVIAEWHRIRHGVF